MTYAGIGMRLEGLGKVLPIAAAPGEGSPGHFLLLPQPSTIVGIKSINDAELHG